MHSPGRAWRAAARCSASRPVDPPYRHSTRKTFTAMIEGVREAAIGAGLIGAPAAAGIIG